MISEATVKTLHSLLSDEEKAILKIDILDTYGSDIGQKIDKNPAIQQSINKYIYDFVKHKYSEQVDKILFDANETVDNVSALNESKNASKAENNDLTTIKDFVGINIKNNDVLINSMVKPVEPMEPVEDKADQNEKEDQKKTSEKKKRFNFNLILDGRTKASIFIEKSLSGLDEESREIIIKCLLYISIFITIVSFLLILLNTSNINQIQSLYDGGQMNFLYQYAQICEIDVNTAKNNSCVISEINKRITELSNSRFWNTIGVSLFSVLSLFFFYQMTTYRQSKDKGYKK